MQQGREAPPHPGVLMGVHPQSSADGVLLPAGSHLVEGELSNPGPLAICFFSSDPLFRDLLGSIRGCCLSVSHIASPLGGSSQKNGIGHPFLFSPPVMHASQARLPQLGDQRCGCMYTPWKT